MFAKILKTLRKENDTTQCELADKLGVKFRRRVLDDLA